MASGCVFLVHAHFSRRSGFRFSYVYAAIFGACSVGRECLERQVYPSWASYHPAKLLCLPPS